MKVINSLLTVFLSLGPASGAEPPSAQSALEALTQKRAAMVQDIDRMAKQFPITVPPHPLTQKHMPALTEFKVGAGELAMEEPGADQRLGEMGEALEAWKEGAAKDLEGYQEPPPRPRMPTLGKIPAAQLAAAINAPAGVVGMALAEAQKQGVDPLLVLAVVKQESRFDTNAVSKSGAKGLMQLMPGTGEEMGVPRSLRTVPVLGLRGGVRYLKKLLGMFDEEEHAVAAYNAGPRAVQRAGGIPRNGETPNYVDKVFGYYEQFKKKVKEFFGY